MASAPKPIEPIYQAMGAKIAMLRGALGLTQKDIAARTHLTRASVANIEAGRQRLLLHDIDTIASALGTTPKHLMRGIWL